MPQVVGSRECTLSPTPFNNPTESDALGTRKTLPSGPCTSTKFWWDVFENIKCAFISNHHLVQDSAQLPNVCLYGISRIVSRFHASIKRQYHGLGEVAEFDRQVRVEKEVAAGDVCHKNSLFVDMCKSPSHDTKPRELEMFTRLIPT